MITFNILNKSYISNSTTAEQWYAAQKTVFENPGKYQELSFLALAAAFCNYFGLVSSSLLP